MTAYVLPVEEPRFRHRLLPDEGAGPPGSLRAAALRGAAWSGSTRVLVLLLQLVGTAAASRVLLPSEYGLAAIVSVITGFTMLLTQLGLGAAVVQAPRLTESKLCAAFWLNAGSGVVLTLLVAAFAAPLAAVYDEPELRDLVLLAGLTFTVSLGSVHAAVLQRGLHFRLLGALDVLGALVTVVVIVACAHGGLGAKSLVLGPLAAQAVLSGAYWAVVRWRPRGRPTRAALRELWAYGGSLTGFNVVNYWGRNADNLLLGKVVGPGQLGLYSRAYNLMLLPVQQVTSTQGKVLFATFARLADDPVRLRRAYLRSTRALMALTAPLSLGLACTAPAFVSALYGPRWTESAALLSILALSGPAQILGGSTGALYQATARTGEQLRRGSLSVLASLLAIVVGLQWGAAGVATAVTVKSVLLLPVITAGVWPTLGITWGDVLRVTRGPLIAAVVMAAVVAALDARALDGEGPVLSLAVQVVVGVGVYGALLGLLDRPLLLGPLTAALDRLVRHRR